MKTVHRKIGEGDINGAVRVLRSQGGIAEYSAETIAKLNSKHPDDTNSPNDEILFSIEDPETSNE